MPFTRGYRMSEPGPVMYPVCQLCRESLRLQSCQCHFVNPVVARQRAFEGQPLHAPEEQYHESATPHTPYRMQAGTYPTTAQHEAPPYASGYASDGYSNHDGNFMDRALMGTWAEGQYGALDRGNRSLGPRYEEELYTTLLNPVIRHLDATQVPEESTINTSLLTDATIDPQILGLPIVSQTNDTENAPVYCQVASCNVKLKNAASLQRHNHRKHNDQIVLHACAEPGCSYKSIKPTDVDRHALTHTDEKPFRCPHCSYANKRSDNLNRHVRKQHPA